MSLPFHHLVCGFVTVLAMLTSASVASDGRSAFHHSGRLWSPWRYIHASSVTNDGVVIGMLLRDNGGDGLVFRWTPHGGFTFLPLLEPGGWSAMYQATDDGRFIVGNASLNGEVLPVIWRDGKGPFPIFDQIPGIGVIVEGVSLQGDVISGTVYWSSGHYEGYMLSEKHGFETSGHVPGSTKTSFARLPPDGQTVYGAVSGPWGQEGARWTRTRGLEALGDIPGGTVRAFLLDCSNDGRVAVGFGTPGFDTTYAVRWTEANEWQNFGHGGRSKGVSGDGWVVVGTGSNAAFVWDPISGIRFVKDVLEQDFGINLTGWQLREATAISNNGRYIAGWGINPGGTLDDTELWLAEIPPFCYADCDRSTSNGPAAPPVLDVFDFLCFGNRFAVRDPYANCNNDASFDIFDFLCFLDAFEKGCWK